MDKIIEMKAIITKKVLAVMSNQASVLFENAMPAKIFDDLLKYLVDLNKLEAEKRDISDLYI